MKRHHEGLLIATLAGMVIAAAAGFAVQPAMAEGYDMGVNAQVTGVADWDVLNVRRWPASHSQQVGELQPGEWVYVERCIMADVGADWCKVESGDQYGWVNSRYLTLEDGVFN